MARRAIVLGVALQVGSAFGQTEGLFREEPTLSRSPETPDTTRASPDNIALPDEGFPDDADTPWLHEELPRRIVRIDREQLARAREEIRARRPASLLLNPFDNIELRAVVERSDTTASGYTLSGRLEGVPFGTVALVVNGSTIAGTIRTPQGTFAVRSIGADAYVVERVAPPVVEGDDAVLDHTHDSPSRAARDGDASEEDSGDEIDVFVVYTGGARAALGGWRRTQAQIDLAVLETNEAYALSGAAQRIKLVGTVETDYHEADSIDASEGDPVYGHLSLLAGRGDGHMDEVHALRDSYAADLVHLLALHTGGSLAGVAQVKRPFGVTTVRPEQGRVSTEVFAHELGHNMGLLHDRYLDTSNWPFPYSHGYVNQAAFAPDAGPDACWRTIMAYPNQCTDAGLDSRLLLRFSDPNARYPDADGDPLGIAGDAESDGLDGPADATRSLDDTRHEIANFRLSTDRCPYRVSGESIAVGAEGGEFSVAVETDEHCAYAVRRHGDFVALDAAPDGVGSGEVTFRIPANYGPARVGSVLIAGETVEVRQIGRHPFFDVCERNPRVRGALTSMAGRNDCAEVTDFDLLGITALELPGEGLALTPADVDGLYGLRRLDLRDNDMAGEVLAVLVDFEALSYVDLSRNRLTGTIPAELGNLRHVRILWLGNNELTGPIPSKLAELRSVNLALPGNSLSGSIPPEFGEYNGCRVLSLSGNHLTGQIPPELGNLFNSAVLLSNNNLSGPIPPELGRINTNSLRLGGNELTGAIPPELGGASVRHLDLSGNDLTGGIPAELGNLGTRLETLWLRDNRLSGPIPPELANLESLESLVLSDNRLSGSIPPRLSDLPNLVNLNLSGNVLDGQIPPELGGMARLRYLNIRNNRLTGNIPTELGNIATLVQLWLRGNDFTGCVPNSLRPSSLRIRRHHLSGDMGYLGLPWCASLVSIRAGTTVVEGEDVVYTVAADPAPSMPVDVGVRIEGGEAFGVAGGDRTLRIAAGTTSGTVVVETEDDEAEDVDAEVVATVLDGDGYEVESVLRRAAVAVRDDEGLAAPTVSSVMPGDGTLELGWTAPDADVEVTGYDLRYRQLPDGPWSTIAPATDGATSYEIVDLANMVRHLVQVRAVADDVAGAWSVGQVGTPRLCLEGLADIDCRSLLSASETWAESNVELNWRADVPPRLWEGVRVSRGGRVVSLDLRGRQFEAPFPPELGGLTELRELSLRYSSLTGEIPAELGGMASLERLDLSNNQLAGSIPPELGGMDRLQLLDLSNNQLTGSIPAELGGMDRLARLMLSGNQLTGPIPAELGGMDRLEWLMLDDNQLTGSIPQELGGLARLKWLDLARNGLTGPIPPELEGLVKLQILDLAGNELSGAIPSELRGLVELWLVYLHGNELTGTIPPELGGLVKLEQLHLNGNQLTGPLPSELGALAKLEHLDLSSNEIDGQIPSALRGLRSLMYLRLSDNQITGSIPAELGGMDRLEWLMLDDNQLTGPIPPELGRLHRLEILRLGDNDLSGCIPGSLATVPSNDLGTLDLAYCLIGVADVVFGSQPSDGDSYRLGEFVRVDVAFQQDVDVVGAPQLALKVGSDVRSSSLLAAGDDELAFLYEVGPADRDEDGVSIEADALSLNGGTIRDSDGRDVELELGDHAIANDAAQRVDAVPERELPEQELADDALTLDLWDALGLPCDLMVCSAASSDELVATVRIEGSTLFVDPRGEGTATVTVTATSEDGSQVVRSFAVFVLGPTRVALVPYVPSVGDGVRQGFVRVINHSARAAELEINAIDDDGNRFGPLTLAPDGIETLHFNSDELENGSETKGWSGIGSGRGAWRLEITGRQEFEALAYVRTSDGFLTSMHDIAPDVDGEARIAILNPGSNVDQMSRLRLVNAGREDAAVSIRGIDDQGASPGTEMEVSVPAGEVRTLTSADLEAGVGGTGSLGDGAGKWRLAVSSDQPVLAMSLIQSPGGHLTNLSTIPETGDGTYLVPLFPSASDTLGRQGFVRVVNRSDSTAVLSIAAFDDSDWDYDPLTLTVEAGKTVHFNSDDLELGNEGKGLAGSTGAGQGDWRLELTSEVDMEVLSYIRTTDGFLTSMHDVVPGVENRYRVAVFNPGRNVNQVSRLRLINAGEETAQVTITGVDDHGRSPGDAVRTSVAAGSARSFSAAELESGVAGLDGALGEGVGKWELIVESDQPVAVMSLLESPTGHLTNLSTTPGRAAVGDDAGGGSEPD